MRVSDVTRQKVVATRIDLGDGDIVNVEFDRNAITPRWIESSQERVAENDAQATSRMLAEVIGSWDVTEDDGSQFPPSAENLGRLSLFAQAIVLREIIKASMPSDAEGKASSGPPNTPSSDSADPQMTSPNGPATSPSLEPSASPSLT